MGGMNSRINEAELDLVLALRRSPTERIREVIERIYGYSGDPTEGADEWEDYLRWRESVDGPE